MNSERVTVKRIGPTSALKVGAAVGVLAGTYFFILFFVLVAPILFSANVNPDVHAATSEFGFRLRVLCICILVGAIGGAVTALSTAWVYNIALNLTGGLQLEVAFGRDAPGKDVDAPPAIGSMMSHDE